MASTTSYATRDISSLRAAALLTLKPKLKSRPLPRRTSPEHPDDTSSIASTLRVPPSPELDYGSDDASAEDQNHPPADEGKKKGEKEEGEISDDETHRVAQPGLSMEDVDNEPLPGLTSILNHDTNSHALSGPNGSVQSSGQLGSCSNPQPLDQLPTKIAENSPSQSVASSLNSTFSQFSMPSSLFMPSSIKVDAEHARPSLRMTAEEFTEAKEIILDLLGWNVPPEYLINCGLTREAIYYVFTELNLKLPSNLDISGIAPYCPPGDSLQTILRSSVEQPEKPKSTLPTPSLHSSSVPSDPTFRPSSFVNPRPDSPSPPLSPTTAKIYASSASIQSPRDSISSNTVDMYSEPIPGLQSTFSPHQSHATVVTKNGDQASRPTKDIPRHIYTGNLDEIETLRRQELLARKAALASRRKLDLKKQAISTTIVNTSLPKSPTASPVVSVEAVDNFLKSIASDTVGVSIPTGDNVDVAMEDNEPQPPTPSTSSSVTVGHVAIPLPKKPASKRAVASDWIDYEASSRNGLSNGYGEYTDIRRPSTTSTLSFANIVSNQKVVIDFSDSEDDSPAEDLSRTIPITTTVGNVLQSIKQFGAREATNTRHVPTPEALLLKEQEIKRMKELIAERERNRLKKLANPPKGVTTPPVDSFRESSIPEETGVNNEQQIVDMPIKQEQDITPPLDPSNADTGIPTKQEDSAMQDVPYAGIKLFQLRTSGALFIDKETVAAPAELMTESPVSDASYSETRDVQMDDSFPVSVAAEHTQVASVVPVPDPSRSHHVHPESPQTDAASSSMGRFTSYLSPLASFFFSRSSFVTDDTSPENNSTSSSFLVPLPPILVDRTISEQISHLLRPLREEVVSKLDPMQPLCHFEVPGGGKCQDSTCHNIHLRDFEPTDDQTAEYLSRVLPEPQPSLQMIRTGLSRVRASKQELDFDNRIIQALDHLGIR